MKSEIDKIISNQESWFNTNGNCIPLYIGFLDSDSEEKLSPKPRPWTSFERLTLPSFYNTFSIKENLTISPKELTGNKTEKSFISYNKHNHFWSSQIEHV